MSVASPYDFAAPRLVTFEYGDQSKGCSNFQYTSRAIFWLNLVAMVVLSITVPDLTLAIPIASNVALGALAFYSGVMSRRHPLHEIVDGPSLHVYRRWYALDESVRVKIPVTPSAVNKAAQTDKLTALCDSVETLHTLEADRKKAEALLDSTATELLDSALQAIADEREYLTEIKKLEV